MSLELFMNDVITQPRMKTCIHCKTPKPAMREYFYASPSCKDGLDGSCIPCRLKSRKEYLKHRGGREQQKLYRKTRGNAMNRKRKHEVSPHESALNQIKHNAKRKNRKCSLPQPGTPEYEPYIEYLKTITHCPDCSKEVIWYGANTNESASFDRIDSDGDYTKENVRIVCKRCNSQKHNSPVYKWVALLEKRIEKGIIEEVDPRLSEYVEVKYTYTENV